MDENKKKTVLYLVCMQFEYLDKFFFFDFWLNSITNNKSLESEFIT